MSGVTLKRLGYLLGLTLATAMLAACGSEATSSTDDGETVAVEGGTYTRIAPAELARMLESESDFTLINVHIPYAGEIPGTDLFVPFNEMDSLAGTADLARDSLIVVYCRSGGMSAQAARALVQLGYTNVLDLAGGMAAWTESGHQLVRRER